MEAYKIDNRIELLKSLLKELRETYNNSIVEISPYCDAYNTERENRKWNEIYKSRASYCTQLLAIIPQLKTEKHKLQFIELLPIRHMCFVKENSWNKFMCASRGDKVVFYFNSSNFKNFSKWYGNSMTKEEARKKLELVKGDDGKPKKYIYEGFTKNGLQEAYYKIKEILGL